MLTRLLFGSMVVGALALPTTTQAATACAPRDDIVSKLKEKYGENERGMGLSGTEAVVEIWSSNKTGTWTIVMTKPNGVTCVLAAGDSWMVAPPTKGPKA